MDARTRLMVIERDEGICQVMVNGRKCGRPGAEIDHIIAKGAGGRKGAAKKAIESMENYRVICLKCHTWRHHKQGVKELD